MKLIFESRHSRFFEDVEFTRGDTAKNFVFEEKYINIPIGVVGIDRGLILDFVQDTTD